MGGGRGVRRMRCLSEEGTTEGANMKTRTSSGDAGDANGEEEVGRMQNEITIDAKDGHRARVGAKRHTAR